MKKTIVSTLGVLVVVGLSLAIIPTTRDEIHWHWASHKDETTSYESYLKVWPEGRHAVEARALYDKHGWAEAEAANSVEGFERYVQLHGEGKHVAEAEDSIESLHWREATAANTVAGFERYVQLHGEGKHVTEAEDSIRSLRMDDSLYTAALQKGTEGALREFLSAFPGHGKEAAARQALKDITEGRDVVDLLQEKKIEIQTQGNGIEQITVRVRRLVAYPLTARIPVGTYFVSANPSSQDMVTTAESKVRLDTDDWQDVSPDAACANRPEGIPGSDDTFTVQRSPHQAELARLMPVLDKANVDTETRQAAVWIVTDNADYADLGILLVSQFAFGGSRAINEPETARAMKICDEAGIDITRKRIWNDKETILGGLADGELKKWLQEKK
jgi:hypothetical protein